MSVKHTWVYARASGKLALRLAWLAAVTVAQFLVFPLLLPFYMIRGAHRRAHERKD